MDSYLLVTKIRPWRFWNLCYKNLYMFGYMDFKQNVLITLGQQQNNNRGQSSKFQVLIYRLIACRLFSFSNGIWLLLISMWHLLLISYAVNNIKLLPQPAKFCFASNKNWFIHACVIRIVKYPLNTRCVMNFSQSN